MKKSTKFALQIRATIQRKYRLNSPCKCNAIDNARQSDSAMVNATPIAQSQNSQLFRRQTSPFRNPKTTNPLKSKRVNSKENIYTPKFRLLHCLTTKFTLLAGRCQRHVRTVQKLAIEWPRGPGWRRTSTSAEVGNLRISIRIIYMTIRNCLYTAIRLMLNCY